MLALEAGALEMTTCELLLTGAGMLLAGVLLIGALLIGSLLTDTLDTLAILEDATTSTLEELPSPVPEHAAKTADTSANGTILRIVASS